MAKIQKTTEEVKNIEGYIDNKKNVFVVTGDPHGLLSKTPEEKPIDEIEIDYDKVGDLLKKYKPNF
jgi:hypothetical protein